MSLKSKYFNSRNHGLSVTNNNGSAGREVLAIREIATFKKLCRIKDLEPKLDGSTFLDLGSGDQFLWLAVDGTNYISSRY